MPAPKRRTAGPARIRWLSTGRTGKAGGKGLGFNGGELLALAIGGCFCNDLRYVAHARGMALAGITVKVTLDLAGDPLLATGA